MAFIWIVGAIAIFLVGAYAGVVAVASLASHLEDRANSMKNEAPTRLANGARILNGLYVRTP
jgi:hypothetical protein